MSIIRGKRSNSFTVIDNQIVNDDRLDWKEFGLLAYLLSKPDNWEVCPVHLASIRKTKRDGIYSILKSLCELGYASKKPNPKGGWDWVITENPNTENTDTANNAESGKTRIRKNPHTEKPTQVNTDNKTKTDYLLNTEFSLSSENENLPKIDLSTDSKFEPISQPEPESELTNAQKIIMAVVKVQNREMPEQELKILMWAVSGCERNDMHWSNLLSKYPDRFEKYLNGTLGTQYQEFEAKKTRASGINTNTGNSFNKQNVGGNYAGNSNIVQISSRKLSTAERQLASVQRAVERELWEKQQQGQQYEPDLERAVY